MYWYTFWLINLVRLNLIYFFVIKRIQGYPINNGNIYCQCLSVTWAMMFAGWCASGRLVVSPSLSYFPRVSTRGGCGKVHSSFKALIFWLYLNLILWPHLYSRPTSGTMWTIISLRGYHTERDITISWRFHTITEALWRERYNLLLGLTVEVVWLFVF